MRVGDDAGHGAPDPGAVGPTGLQEAAVTLAAAYALKDALTLRRHQVVMTRYGPRALNPVKAVDLAKRCNQVNTAKVDCFVSIHCNAAADQKANGFEVMHDGQSARGKHLAECIHAAVQKADLVRSKGETAISSPDELTDRGVKTQELYVLNHTHAPAVLIELAFISNPDEEARLRNPRWLQRMAEAIADGVDAWGKLK